jgi:hypothetical protein
MFVCGICKEPQPLFVKPIKVVLETRNREYDLDNGEVSYGTEIVKEADACGSCAIGDKFKKLPQAA